MSRKARKKVESKTYHIVLRGINKQTVFFDEEDREVFLSRIKIAKEKSQFSLYAFCLMTNHIHLLIKEKDISLSVIFRNILSSYVFWYNRKYKRVGNLFQDRFRSEGIESDEHLLCAIRYIHQNPLKGNIVETIEEYKWSSHAAYVNKIESFVDAKFPIDILGGIDEYKLFISIEETMSFEENDSKEYISDEELHEKIQKILKQKEIYDILKCNKDELVQIVTLIREKIVGVSIRQISRVTGIPVSIVRYI